MPNPPDSRAQRIRAMWKSRACAASLAVGSQTFCLAALCALPQSLSSVWLCALPALLLAPLLGLLCQRRLRKQMCPGPLLYALLSLSLLSGVVFLLCALVALCGQSLLPQSRGMTILVLTLAALFACALPGLLPCANAAFALRFLLPALLLGFCLCIVLPVRCAGLFPLLGRGLLPTLSGSLCVLGGAAPALSLFVLPTQDEGALECLPPARFFAVRLFLGALVAVLLLFLLSMGNTFEQLLSRALFADRLRLTGRSVSASGFSALVLVLAQIAALLLSAAYELSCAVRLLRPLMGKAVFLTLPLLLAFCLAALSLLLRFGMEYAAAVAPFLLSLSLLLVFWPGRKTS